MPFKPTDIDGVFLLESETHSDERGLFARIYDEKDFVDKDLPTHWPQHNLSWNDKKGTLRGMHYQAEPHPEPKVVRCTHGRVFDVAVDLRPDSQTYKKWTGHELSADNRHALYIPTGCAHGFLSLEDGCEVLYLMGETYAPDCAHGVRWDDPAFDIQWPAPPEVISDRDANWPDYQS